jgi:hypothetical protein
MTCSSSCSTMWCSLKHNMWGFRLSTSKECINSSLLFLSPLIFLWKIFIELDDAAFCLWTSKTAGQHLIYVKHQCAFRFEPNKGEALAGVITGLLLHKFRTLKIKSSNSSDSTRNNLETSDHTFFFLCYSSYFFLPLPSLSISWVIHLTLYHPSQKFAHEPSLFWVIHYSVMLHCLQIVFSITWITRIMVVNVQFWIWKEAVVCC